MYSEEETEWINHFDGVFYNEGIQERNETTGYDIGNETYDDSLDA